MAVPSGLIYVVALVCLLALLQLKRLLSVSPLPFQHGVGVHMAWVAICSAALFHSKGGALVEMEMEISRD
jgi:hypothetical protein